MFNIKIQWDMRINKVTGFLLGYYVLMLIYWAGLNLSGIKDLDINLMYSFSLNLMCFLGGVFGLSLSKQWGGLKSSVGRGVGFLSAGLVSWGTGGFIWSFYNFVLRQEVPYPSLADVGFVGALPLWTVGIVFLSQATGVKFAFRKMYGRLMTLVFPILGALVSYYFLFMVARNSVFEISGGLLKIILDFTYPLGDWVILTTALLVWGLSFNYLGGRYKWPVITLLLGFVLMFFADFSFSYATTVGNYFNGSYPDLLFATALFVIGFGINSLDTKEGD